MISTAALALAFTAGLVATVNPCGFAMLPVYLSFFMGSEGDRQLNRPAALLRAMKVGSVVSLGFIGVFGLAGVLLNVGLRADLFSTVLPWLALAVGAAVLVLGIAMVRGFYLNVRLPGVRGAKKERTLRSMFVFGISYAIASLSCTLPVFLSLVTANFAQQSILGGTLTFIVYGLGMSTVLLFLTLAMALGRDSIVKRMRQSAQYINKISGVILVVAGLFIIWYWGTILTQGAAVAGQNGVVRWVDELSATLTNFIGDNRRTVIAVLVGTVGTTILYVIAKVRLSPPPPPPPSSPAATDDAEPASESV